MMARQGKVPGLEAPGAGLPGVERLLARIGLTAYAATATKAQVLGRFRLEAERAIGLVDGLAADVVKRRVPVPRPLGVEDSSRDWSAAMTLEHLVIVNRGITGIIIALCDAETDAVLPAVRIEDVKPSEAAGTEQIYRLRKTVIAYARVVERADSLRTRRRHPHPWFGPMDARGWHALAAIHNGLHRRQLEAIVRQLAS